MRRVFGLTVIVMAFVVGSSSALAATSQKVTIKALIGEGGWEVFDEDTGAGEFGDLQFAIAEGKTTVSLVMSSGELVLCDGVDTPDDPSDDVYGFVGTETYGEGVGRMTVGKTYSSAVATGTVDAEVYTFDECTGDEGTVTRKKIAVALDLTGISAVITQKVRSTISIPKRLRSKTILQAQSREAAGSLKVGSRTIEVGGIIGQLQMRASLTTR
jgi:hypothetical protein